MYTDRCGNIRRQKCCTKGSGKEVEIQKFMYRDTTMWNLKCTIIPIIWSHWNSNEKLKAKFGSCAGKTLDRFTTIDSYTWDIAQSTESIAV